MNKSKLFSKKWLHPKKKLIVLHYKKNFDELNRRVLSFSLLIFLE